MSLCKYIPLPSCFSRRAIPETAPFEIHTFLAEVKALPDKEFELAATCIDLVIDCEHKLSGVADEAKRKKEYQKLHEKCKERWTKLGLKA